MGLKIQIILSVICIFLFMPQIAHSDLTTAEHNGSYFGFGFGHGSAGLNVRDFPVEMGRENGLSINLRLGAANSQNTLLGLEADIWLKNENSTTIQFHNYAIGLIHYFSDYFFIKVGPAFTKTFLNTGNRSSSENGFGVVLGGGIEARIGKEFALVPSFQYIFQEYHDYSSNFYSIILGFNWFFSKHGDELSK